jgi:hypothetical protein
MTRAGQEPAQDVKRRLVAACKETGMKVTRASARLVNSFDARLVHVEASPDSWPHELALLSLMATVMVDGSWNGNIDIRSAPADDSEDALNPPFALSVPYMTGRQQVLLEELVHEIRETVSEREQVIAAAKCGIPGPYPFSRSVWSVPGLDV